MTTEEKAKAYDNLLEKASCITDSNFMTAKEVVEHLFPQLAESEDERIRKEIINYLSNELHNVKQLTPRTNEFEAWIAYLEKQKDSNPSTPEDISAAYQLGLANGRKEQKSSINIDQLKSLMLQYLQEAANEKDDSDIEADTDKWARKILGYDFEQEPAEWSDSVAKEMFIKALERAVEQTKKGYELTDCDKHSWWEDFKAYSGIKPAEWSEEDEGMLNCIIATLCEESHGGREANEKMVTWLENRLKSLRPQQKQEEIVLHWETGHPESYKSVLILRYGNVVVEGEWNKETGRWYQYGFRSYLGDNEVVGWMDKKTLLSGNFNLHPHWKPSEEQMETLNYAYCELFKRGDVGHNILGPFQSLIDTLRKL